jgi:AbrB family looped-hinge helix DNA binding protein
VVIVKLSSKGQIILPKAIRQALAVKAGDYVELTVNRGAVRLMRARSKADVLAGVFRGLAPRPLDWKRLRREVAEQVAGDAVKEFQPEGPN